MKNWQIAVLCFSIIISVAASTFYLKYEPKTLLSSNYGPVNLGKVFSEKVMIDVTLIGNMGNDDKELITAYSFYDKTEPVDKALVNIAESYNRGKDEKNKLKYDEISPVSNDAFELKIRTYITYLSSNFTNAPYTFTVSEETYRLPMAKTLKESIGEMVETNFKNNKERISNALFITDKVAYGLEEESVSSK